jgi:hypothetical protein
MTLHDDSTNGERGRRFRIGRGDCRAEASEESRLSSKKLTDAPLISRQALNRALLARQMLLTRESISALAAIERLAGIQSQAPNPAYFGLWSRLQDFRHDELARLISEREAVRLSLMRSTIHLVSSADALSWRPSLQPVMNRMFESTYGRFLDGVERNELIAEGVRIVEAEPRTYDELGKALLERWPNRNPAALANAIRTAAALVQVPPRGLWGRSGAARHTTIERWLGRSLVEEPDLAAMAKRYLAAYGPASVRDLQTWSGLTKLAPVLESLRPELLTFQDENGKELFDLPAAPRPDAETPVPIRFLAEYDNALLAYADPSRIVSADHRKRVMSVNGIVSGTFLIDGFVHGIWTIKRDRSSAALIVTPFAPLDSSTRAALTEEGAALLAFGAAALEPRILVEVGS